MGVSYPLSGQNKIGLREGMNRCMQKCGISIFEIGLSKISNFENLNNRDM